MTTRSGPSSPGRGTGLLAFARGADADGVPCASDRVIARLLLRDPRIIGPKSGAERVVQWEIADVLAGAHGEILPPRSVLWPPTFAISAMRDPDRIARRLLACAGDPSRPEGLVYESLDARAHEHLAQLGTLRSSRLAATLVVAFNKLLDSRQFSVTFRERFAQTRDAPAAPSIPMGLTEEGCVMRVRPTPPAVQRGHAMQVNRALLESIFFHELRPARVPADSAICRWVVLQFPHVREWTVFAHPDQQAERAQDLIVAARDAGMAIQVQMADCDQAGQAAQTGAAPAQAAERRQAAIQSRTSAGDIKPGLPSRGASGPAS